MDVTIPKQIEDYSQALGDSIIEQLKSFNHYSFRKRI